ncbi:hypothetical protein HELRODRAFT_164350 [Helobdella robusta]|uniref:Uncharacterized protein n=1 Tax=Helobdella robusta TaxID=6412 RepID=T1EVA9_HELRO|nr:hypothetical protein HELRODRAFT_164350 [Helobdella robusta]ESN94493.1 hypothetical protein HELRODRAFT_164350 [Helobdella robusta]
MNLPHPFSLPSMVGRPRLSFQHFNSSNRLQSQTGSQPLRPPYAYSSKMLSNTNESCSNNFLSTASELKSSLQAPSLLRNFSSTITSSSSIDRSKQNCSISNSSSKSNSPTFQVAPQLQQHQQHLPQQQQQYQRQQQQHPQQQSQLTRSSPSPSLTSSTSKVIRTPSKLSMLQQPSKLAMKSNSKMLSSSSATAAPKNALAYDAVDAADADYNNVSNCSSQSNESSNSSCSYRQNTTAAKSFLNASHVSNHTSLKPAPSNQDISMKRTCNGPPIKPCYNGSNTNASIKQPPQPTSASVDNKQSSTSSSSFSTSSTTATTTKSIPRMSSIPRSRLKPPTKLEFFHFISTSFL